MSTEWTLLCADCDTVTEDLWINHGEEKLSAIWHARKTILALFDAAVLPYWDIDLTINYYTITYQVLAFLKEHDTHDVVLLSEYNKRAELVAQGEST